MDDLLIRVLTRLVRVHDELGESAFEDAAHRALVAIALAVQVEANSRAGAPDVIYPDGVLPFPLERRLMTASRAPGDEGA